VIALDVRLFDAALFDLDGVITDTAVVHAEAWREMFDAFLSERSLREGEEHRPFSRDDYLSHVDGKPRHDGVRAFLASRGIDLPAGDPSDTGERETAHGLGNRKDRYFNQRLQEGGVAVFESTVALVRELQAAGVATGVFSASRNCRTVLEAAGLGGLFEVRVDGEVAEELDLAGKPDPAMLLEAARRLGAEPQRTLVVEDAQAGVEAGRRGGFGLVVGVDRTGQAAELRAHGADVVVSDLGELEVLTGEVTRSSDAWGDVP
jgi:alpha,alpha-trehalase